MPDANLTVQIDGRDNLTGELKRIESGVIRFVGAMSSAFTTLAAIGFPIKEAADFQKEILNAAKTTEYTEQSMAVLQKGLRDLSNQIDLTAVDLAKIATMGGQMGIGANENAAQLVSFVKSTATAVTSLGMSAEDVVNAFGKVVNIFNVPQEAYRNAMSSILKVANASTATADQLFDVVRRIGNLGGAVDLPGAAALSAGMVDLGLTAETAGTTLTKIFANMKSQAREFSAVIKGSGGPIKSMEDWIDLLQSGKGIDALNMYADALNKMSVADASQLKMRLTGAGRLFEAISKVQAQRKTEVALLKLAEEAEKRVTDAEQGRTAVTTQGLAAIKAQAEALRESANQASIIGRLNKAAQAAWTTGDVAEKAQKLVLSGLAAQWQVFFNNIKTLAAEAGQVFLPPLTLALESASKAMQDPVNAASLKQAAMDILNFIKAIGDGIGYLSNLLKTLKGSGIDWGAVLGTVAALVGYVALKGLISLLGALGRTILGGIPGINALSAALFGVAAPVAGAKAGLDGAAASAVRTGGIFNNVAGRISASLVTTATALSQLGQTRNRVNALLTDTQGKASNSLAVNANLLLQNRLSRLQSISAIEARITAQQQRYNALIAQGNLTTAQKRSASSIAGDITYLTKQRDALAANEQAAARYNMQVGRLTGILGTVDAQIAKVDWGARFTSFIAPVANAGKRMADAFVTNFRAGSAAGLSGVGGSIAKGLEPAAIRAAALGSSLGTSILNGFMRLDSAMTSGASRISDGIAKMYNGTVNLAKGFVSATAAAKGLGAGNVFAGILSGLSGVAGQIGKMFIGGAAGAIGAIQNLFANLGRGIGGAILQLAGLDQKWAETHGKGNRAMVGLAAGVTVFGKAIGMVGRLLMSAFNFIFIGIMVVEVLKAIGLWDELAGSIGKVIKMLGFKVPSFLQSDAEQKQATRETEAITRAFEGANLQASKFNNEMRALVLMSQDAATATKDIKFDVEDPTKGLQKSAQYIQAIITGFSAWNAVQGRIEVNERQLTEEKRKQSAAQKELTLEEQRRALGGGTLGSDLKSYKADLAQATAAVGMLEEERSKLKAQQDGLGPMMDGLKNVVSAALDAADAQRLLGRENMASLSALEQYAANQNEIGRQTALLADAESKLKDDRDKARGDIVATKAANDAYATSSGNAKTAIERLTEANKNLGKSLLDAAHNKPFVDGMLQSIKTNTDPAAVDRFVTSMQNLANIQFKGIALPKVEANDLVNAGVTYEVNRRISEMYGKWAEQAKAAALRAKNYASQALGEVEKLARQTEATIAKLIQNAAQMKNKASNQLADRADDAQSRQYMRDVQTQYDYERALLEQQFAIKNRMLAEQEAGGVRVFAEKQQQYGMEQQALFMLEEKYLKIREIEQDRLNIKKAQRGVQQELQQYDQLIKKLEYYNKQVAEANKTISNPEAAADAKLGALEKRNNALDKMKAIYGQLEGTAEKLSTLEPIGGQLLISEADLARIRAGVETASRTLGNATLEGAGAISGAYDEAAKKLDSMTNDYAVKANVAKMALAGFGVPIETAAAAMGQLLGQSQAFREVVADIGRMTKEGWIDPSKIDFGKIAQQAQTAIEGLSKVTPTSIPLTIEEAGLADQVKNAILKGASLASGGETAKVQVDVSNDSFARMTTQIEQGVHPQVQVDAVVRQRGGPVGATGSWARGGFIGDAVRFSEQISRYATGAFVSGPGGPTDDKVPAWLSPGEYVIDAFTTGAFGPKFFAFIQSIARGGMSANFLKNLKFPHFAGGGLNARPLAFAGIANDFNSSGTVAAVGPRDVIDVNIQSGNQRATIQAEREQAKALVGILRNFERGR